MPRRNALVMLLLFAASVASSLPLARADEGQPSPAATPAGTALTPVPDAERFVPIGDSEVRGPRNAPVTITMFGDFQCEYSKNFTMVLTRLLEKYPNDVNFVMKQWPIARFAYGTTAARAALAAREQGKFWEMFDALYKASPNLNDDSLRRIAQSIGLDVDRWESDRASTEIRRQVDADLALGKLLGVTGTPTLFVNHVRTNAGATPVMTFENFDLAIKAQLNGTAPPPSPRPTPPPPRLTATPMAHVSPASLDARTLSLGEPLKLDDTGYRPVFSPQGERILYVKSASNGAAIAMGGGGGSDHSLWVVNANGGDARHLIQGASAGVWSPDAAKIAFLWEGGGLALFDLATEKIFPLLQNESNYELYGWSPDGGSIVVGFADHSEHRYRNIALNLDDLKRMDITTGKEDRAATVQKLRRAFQNDPLADMFYANHCYWDVFGHAPPRHVAGIWARDLKGAFAKLLRDAPLGTLALSPDHSRIAFGTVNPVSPVVSTGLYVATLGANDTASPRTFRLAFDQAFLAKAFGRNTKRCLAEGPLVASVYSPKRNPLNDKVVGAGDTWRGNVHLSLPDKTGQATADIVVERMPFGTDSVLHELWVGSYDRPPQTDTCVFTLPPDMAVELHAP